MVMATATQKPTAAATAEAEAKAALAKKREDAALLAKAEEYRRDVPPGIEEIEAAQRANAERYANACAAFTRAQAKFETIVFDKENPHFHSKYASLASIYKATRKALTDEGIALMSRTIVRGESIYVETFLAHKGVVFIRSEWIAGKTSQPPQALGSALTYARRYTTTAILGVAADDDDDGNAATPPPSVKTPTTTKGKTADF